MNKDRIDGATKQNSGAVKQATKALFCNTILAAEGKHRSAAGRAKGAKK
jgi:uncharacterized protein YjbJ (UPF0337 family)